MNPNRKPAGERRAGGPPRPAPSQLFALRLWQAELGQDQTEWRGQLQHVVSGQTRYFRDWPTLTVQLVELLAETASPPADANGAEP